MRQAERFHSELPLPCPGPASPLPQEYCSSTLSVGWAGLCPHPRGTGLITPPRHIPDSVVWELLALCNPKADQTYLSQPEDFLTFLLLSSQWSIFLWKGQNSADEHPFPPLCIFSLLYLLMICLYPSSVKVVSLTLTSDWISRPLKSLTASAFPMSHPCPRAGLHKVLVFLKIFKRNL